MMQTDKQVQAVAKAIELNIKRQFKGLTIHGSMVSGKVPECNDVARAAIPAYLNSMLTVTR